MNQGKKGLSFAILMFFLFLTACTFTVSVGPPETKTVGPHRIDVQIRPDPAVMLKENEFQVTVRDKEGKPVEKAKVNVALSMADMDHGDLSFACEEVGDGIYKGKGIPVMAGEWIATVSVEKEGEKSMTEYIFQATRSRN